MSKQLIIFAFALLSGVAQISALYQSSHDGKLGDHIPQATDLELSESLTSGKSEREPRQLTYGGHFPAGYHPQVRKPAPAPGHYRPVSPSQPVFWPVFHPHSFGFSPTPPAYSPGVHPGQAPFRAPVPVPHPVPAPSPTVSLSSVFSSPIFNPPRRPSSGVTGPIFSPIFHPTPVVPPNPAPSPRQPIFSPVYHPAPRPSSGAMQHQPAYSPQFHPAPAPAPARPFNSHY
jgi:hypothetical protein